MGEARRKRQPPDRRAAGASAAVPTSDIPATAGPAPPAVARWAAVAILLALTALAFHPALRGELLSWDDRAYVSANPMVREAGGLTRIWDPNEPTRDQYYPLTFTSYWLEYRLWQANPVGYHAVNLALHLLNVVLAVLLVQALGASWPVALGAAAIFALHPVQVASVAWVAERKNVLSGVFYLAAFLLYLRHRRTGSWRSYSGALVAFAAALLSKTQVVTLPVSLLLVESLLRGPARLRRLSPAVIAMRLAPLLILGVLAASVTARVEHGNLDWTRMPAVAERPLVAAGALWFYAGKFFLPVSLSPVYPRWDLAELRLWLGLGLLVWPLVVFGVWRYRQRLGALTVWGLAHFAVAAAPILGLMPFGLQQHSLVADHYMYLSLLGGGLALAYWVAAWAARLAGERAHAVLAAAGVLVSGVLAVGTYRETQHWLNDEVFWTHVLASNPACVPGQHSMAYLYRAQRRWDKALPHFRAVTELRPDHPRLFREYVNAVWQVQGNEAAVRACTEKIQRNPEMLVAYLERAQIYERQGRRAEAQADYEHVLAQPHAGADDRRAAHDGLTRLRTRP